MNLGQKIEQLLKTTVMTKVELAKKLGLKDSSVISHWVKNRFNVKEFIKNAAENHKQAIFKYNPMYQFLTTTRDIVVMNHAPSVTMLISCGVWAVGMLLFGCIVFKKNQDKFIYYI